MSWQAVQAVRDNSQTDNPTGYAILSTIASYCDANGTMDNCVKPPSQDTLMAGARVSKPTLISWVKRFEDDGELTVKRVGKGRGSKNFYTINLPMPAYDLSPKTAKAGSEINSKDNGKDGLESIKNELEELKLMVKQMVMDNAERVSNGKDNGKDTTRNRVTNSKINGKDSQINGKVMVKLEPINGKVMVKPDFTHNLVNNINSNTTTPYSPPSSKNQEVEIVEVVVDEKLPIVELSEYFIELTGCRFRNSRDLWWVPLTEIYQIARSDFEKTKQLMKIAVGVMRRDGYNIAYPSSIVSACYNHAHKLDLEYAEPENEMKSNASLHWVDVMEKARKNMFDFRDELVKKAVQKTGWGNLRTMEISQIPMYKKLFIDNYKELSSATA